MATNTLPLNDTQRQSLNELHANIERAQQAFNLYVSATLHAAGRMATQVNYDQPNGTLTWETPDIAIVPESPPSTAEGAEA